MSNRKTNSNYAGNINISEQEIDFSSEFEYGEKEFYEVNSSVYINLSKLFIILFIPFAMFTISQIFRPQSFALDIIIPTIIAGILIGIYIYINFVINKSYKRTMFLQGKSAVMQQTVFSDRIIVLSEQRMPDEYEYAAVISVVESNLFYMLFVQQNLCVLVAKNSLCGGTKEEFLKYIFAKCHNIKKKKINKTKSKKAICFTIVLLTLVMYIIMLAVSVVNIMGNII